MKTKNILIATAGSESDLLKIVQGYFYSPGIFFAEGRVQNSTGALRSYAVTQRGRRWRFERIPENAN
jgi:hypothetical protein